MDFFEEDFRDNHFVKTFWRAYSLSDATAPKWFIKLNNAFTFFSLVNLAFYIACCLFHFNIPLFETLSFYNLLIFVLWMVAYFVMSIYFQYQLLSMIYINNEGYDSKTMYNKSIEYAHHESICDIQIALFMMSMAVIVSLYIFFYTYVH